MSVIRQRLAQVPDTEIAVAQRLVSFGLTDICRRLRTNFDSRSRDGVVLNDSQMVAKDRGSFVCVIEATLAMLF